MTVVVETRQLSKHFDHGDVHAVDGVDIATEEGEYLVLLGPSGSGKSTLLRMIAGLEQPTAGDVLIGGNVVTGLPPRARQIAMVFQSYALYPHKTVRDNIIFPLRAEKMDKAEQRRRLEWATTLLGIEHLLNRKPRALSGGERQRVALARALVREPAVFLLDEPLSNLDAKLRAAARDDLKQFQRRIGTTTIYVTHDQVEAMGMGDRIAILHQGRLRQLGPPTEVYNDPADTFVATFIGSPPMNLITREDVLVGFRPESLLPADLISDGDVLRIPFKVNRVENLGSDRHLYGNVGAIGEETRVIARLPSTITLEIIEDETYEFAVHERDLRFFDIDTGERTTSRPLRA